MWSIENLFTSRTRDDILAALLANYNRIYKKDLTLTEFTASGVEQQYEPIIQEIMNTERQMEEIVIHIKYTNFS